MARQVQDSEGAGFRRRGQSGLNVFRQNAKNQAWYIIHVDAFFMQSAFATPVLREPWKICTSNQCFDQPPTTMSL